MSNETLVDVDTLAPHAVAQPDLQRHDADVTFLGHPGGQVSGRIGHDGDGHDD